jgi:hypothetical protein
LKRYLNYPSISARSEKLFSPIQQMFPIECLGFCNFAALINTKILNRANEDLEKKVLGD